MPFAFFFLESEGFAGLKKVSEVLLLKEISFKLSFYKEIFEVPVILNVIKLSMKHICAVAEIVPNPRVAAELLKCLFLQPALWGAQ